MQMWSLFQPLAVLKSLGLSGIGESVCPANQQSGLKRHLSHSDIVLLPITPAIAARAVDLPEHHSDPQDRIIIATAIEHQAKLMSDDGKFPAYLELNGHLL